ncbi:hypothetical protein KI688_012136 [Linnemannia hyalina]|uniref:Uncharacterized protein n=1 Tax=Linnemannia hyalina TaxID=64524 RepID=A0A9P7XVE6_9FUNG|nr:hypothetical protein KI688_012136 [Linnemannia hyalina]
MPSPRGHRHHSHNNSQKAHNLDQLEHIIEDDKQLFYDLANIHNNNQSPPTCTRHPRWITFGCIIFSVMLSSTLLMTKNWQSRTSVGRSGGALDGEREWRWQEMDPWKAIALAEMENSKDSTSPSSMLQPQQGQDQIGQGSDDRTSPSAQGIKTWDLNDPALALGTFLDSPDWKSQPLIPGADFVNLLRVLRPVDHAFFITLFVNQSPGRLEAAREGGKGMSPKASAIPIHGQHGCGSWIQDYIEYQSAILDGTLAARYTVHACSSATTHIPSQQQEQEQEHDQEREKQPCGNVFSQMIAMTSAFAWSVKESRGFFLRPDQIRRLQDSFRSPVLQQQWSFPFPPRLKVASAAKVDTEEMTTQGLETLFGLEDALFSGTDDGTVDQAQDRLWVMRSKSRNRVSFERTLSAPNDSIVHPYQPSSQLNRGGQQHPSKAMSPIQVKKLKDDLESEGVELILQQDLLPLFVNTTHTLDQFIDLGLPLPHRILEDHQIRHQSKQQHPTVSSTVSSTPTSIRAPSARGSLFSPSYPSLSSSSSISHKAITTALHAATHDSHDISRIQAAPKTFGCFLDILLQPQLNLQQLIHPYATLFQLPAIFSIGIFIKSDPSTSSTPTTPHSSSWKSMSANRQRTVDRYLTCARQIVREFAPKRKGQKVVYVVVSEDPGMARVMESQEEWDEEVIAPSWTRYKDRHHRQPVQPHQNDPSTGPGPAPEPMQLTKQQQQVLENWVLSKTDYQVVSDQSDFAKVAVWRTRREGRSVVIRENPALEQFMASGGQDEGYVDMLDCGILLNNLINRD